MNKKNIIDVLCFGQEIGKVGFNENENRSFFQYNPEFLKANKYLNIFPKTGIIRRMPQTQIFSKYNNETFKGLPPQIADSLPDMFGNIVFKTWLEANNKEFKQISIIEQLAYVSNRGMGALEYRPSKVIPQNTNINIGKIVDVLKNVVLNKKSVQSDKFNNEALLNIFKIGTSAGGARPKILISENKKTREIISGDLECSAEYNHYLVKLAVEDDLGYSRELIEYCYYLTASNLNIRMMPSKLVENIHFATLRFDRQNGQKKHVLTVSGMTGWDFKSPENSSYENLFDLSLFLKIPHNEIEELYRRMIFNIVFCNTDDHLKNHSFIYNEIEDRWNLTPAYDLTYSLNPLMNHKRISRALSINNKRVDLTLKDVLKIAELYTVGDPKGIISDIQDGIDCWMKNARELDLPPKIINSIKSQFKRLV